MKQQINFRASELTSQQLAQLTQQTGMLQTEVIAVAIDRMFREEIKMKIVSDYLGREFDSAQLEKDFGTVNHNGEKLYLTQSAYAVDGNTYQATAINQKGNDYTITWQTTAKWDALDTEDQEDESKACDWSKYTVSKN